MFSRLSVGVWGVVLQAKGAIYVCIELRNILEAVSKPGLEFNGEKG